MPRSMPSFAIASLLAFLILPSNAYADQIHVGPFVVVLPDSFAGPTRAAPDSNTEIVAYASHRNDAVPANVIEFTRYTVGSAPPNADENTYAEGAQNYLLQMLQGVERRRTDYLQPPVTRLRLGGHVAARATWTGTLQGVPLNGVMYCAIIGTDAWFVHAFGPGNRPDSDLQSVIAAIEHSGH
jgi:hypothetical protein